MESRHDESPISTLKVDFHCSKDCPLDVKKRLQKFTGVESVSIDPKQGLVTVLGKVNPMVLVKFLQKMGQRAELWSFQKAPMLDEIYSVSKENTHRSHRNINSRCCCHHDDDSDSDSDSSDGDSHHGHSSKKSTIYWEHPQLKAMNGKRSKKNNGWKDMLGFGNYFVKPEAWIRSPRRPKNFPAPPPITTYNPLLRFYGSTQPMYARAPPPLSPYGRSSLMRRFINPMIHYRSYADNYRYPM